MRASHIQEKRPQRRSQKKIMKSQIRRATIVTLKSGISLMTNNLFSN